MALTKTPIELSSTPSIVDGGNATAITIDSSEDVTLAGELKFADDKKAIFGAGSDLEIYHTATGNHSIIEETGGGNLVVRTNGAHIEFDKGSTEYMARMIPDGAVELYYDSALKLATASGGVAITGDITGVTDLYVDDQIISTGDTNTYMQFHGADSWRVVTAGAERMNIIGNSVVFNDDGHDANFRVETDDEANMFTIVGGSNMVMLGSTTAAVTTQFQISSTSDRHQLALTSGSNTSISTSGSADYAEGVVAISTGSSGDVLSIPIFSQSNLWRPMYVELMFVSGEYNKTSGKGGFAKLTFAALNSISALSQIAVGGNVASVSSSGMNITVTFTSAYNAGLNDKEGVFMHYKVLSYTTDYFQAWNATLN